MTRLAVTGATGTMGSTVLELAKDRADISVGLAISRSGTDKTVAGVAVRSAETLPAGLGEESIDVLVDFTGPDSSVEYVERAADAGVAAVVGTTGFTEAQRDRLRSAAEREPVLVAANFSRGVRALHAALEPVLERLAAYDIEVTETHHNRKRDAPSGTATELLETIETSRESKTRVHGRVGEQPRQAGEIGVHARRAGTIAGEHEILLAGDGEALTLTHRAESRAVFAAGALDAAVWLEGRESGWYSFEEVLTSP